MRYIGHVKGFKNDFKNKKLFQPKEFQVNYTDDGCGKSLSIGDGDIQFHIPFDELYKIINRRR
jgi:hypothetical protein